MGQSVGTRALGKCRIKRKQRHSLVCLRDSRICHVRSESFIFEETTEKEAEHPLVSRVSCYRAEL